MGICAWTTTVRDAAAQAPTRDGFFIGLGVGWGSFGLEDVDERASGVSGYFKIGGALSPTVLFGAESNGWYKEDDGVTLTTGNISAVAYLYPMAGLFLKLGFGVARVEVDGSLGSVSDSGPGLTLGLGYDVGRGGRFALTPFAGFFYGSFEGRSTNTFQVGLGFNWY